MAKIVIIYLKCNAVKELGKKQKSRFSRVKTQHKTTRLQPFLQTPVLQLNETLFFVISMVQTIGAISMFKIF